MSIYGTCNLCGAEIISRERRMNGNDRCKNGHITPSSETVRPKPPEYWNFTGLQCSECKTGDIYAATGDRKHLSNNDPTVCDECSHRAFIVVIPS